MRQRRADLLIMGRHLANGWGGVYEVLRGLVEALDRHQAAAGRRIELLVPREGLEPGPLRRVKVVALNRWGGSRLMWDHLTVPAYANRRAGAVLYNPGIVLPARLRIPAIISIHDMAYFPPPELSGRSEYLAGDAWYMRRMIRRGLKRAAGVHVPSASTLREVQRIAPWAGDQRLHVWPYGVDAGRWVARREDAHLRGELRARGVEPPYLLYPGGLSRRKNVGVLIRALLAYRGRHPAFRLVLTGGPKRTLGERGIGALLAQGEASGWVVRLGEVSHAELRLLYQDAWAMVYPSLYEGFGLPPLEAQAAGCPVICSASTSLPEVVGEAAILFDGTSTPSLVAALERLEAEGERERLSRAGRMHAQRRGWDVMALNLLGLADRLLGGGGAADRGAS